MFRLLYSDGSTSETADSVAAVQALYTGTLVARIQQRRSADVSGWMTISNDINGREGAFVITVGDIADNSSVASTTLPDQPTTARSQVGTVNPATGLVTYTTEADEEEEEIVSSLTGTYRADATIGTRADFAADTVLPEWGGMAAPEGSEAIATSLELVESGGTVTGTYTDDDGIVATISGGTYDSDTGAVSFTSTLNLTQLWVTFTGTLAAGTLAGTITVLRSLGSGSAGSSSEERSFSAAAGGSLVSLPTTRYYVDSLDGDDGNAGTSADAPLATIGALPALSGSEGVYLARGSRWREELAEPSVSGVTLRAYGAGPRPILDEHDVLTAGSFSLVGGTTNVYAQSFTPDTSGTGYPVVLENGRPLAKVADAATADATAGTYYVSADYAGGAAITIGVHPFGSTNPTSDGKVYEANSRDTPFSLAGTTTVRSIHCRGGAGKDQASPGVDCTITDCVFTHAASHNLVAQGDATVQRSVFTLWGEASIGDPTPCTVFTSPGGVDAVVSGCAFVGDPRMTTVEAAQGILAHGGTGEHATVTVTDCGIAYAQALLGAVATDTVTVTDCVAERHIGLPGFAACNDGAADFIVSRCAVWASEAGYNGLARFLSDVAGAGTTVVTDCLFSVSATNGGIHYGTRAGTEFNWCTFGELSRTGTTRCIDDQAATIQMSSFIRNLVINVDRAWDFNTANTATYNGVANGAADYNQYFGVARWQRGVDFTADLTLADVKTNQADLEQNSIDTAPSYVAGTDSGVRPTWQISSGGLAGGVGVRYGDTVTLDSGEWPVPALYQEWRDFIESL